MHSLAHAAERVEIRFDVPMGAAQYSGPHPVSFGVPFERGTLRRSDGLRVVGADGRPLPAQFEVTATWAPDSNQVRWLLIDLLVSIENGSPPRAFFEFGPDVPTASASTPLQATLDGDEAVVDTGARRFLLSRETGALGQYVLVDGEGKSYRAGGAAGVFDISIEKPGPVRAVVKLTGEYAADDGTSIAEFVTRARFCAHCPFVRIYHTMVWATDARTKIGSLTFRTSAALAGGSATSGVDRRPIGPSPTIALSQTDWNVVRGDARGEHLDGWIEVSNAERSTFAALRWPWQQYPTALSAADGRIEVKLIGPEQPMGLAPDDVAVDYVVPEREKWNLRVFQEGLWSVTHNGPPALPHISPRGVAKTYELLLWYGAPDARVPPQAKSALAQHPVLACADPAFATRAGLPSPTSSRDLESFPVIEGGLDRAFDWIALERATDGDFGVWNYGDVQWSWLPSKGYSIYRYWMNNGKGWSIAPWVLWLRSGDRKYWENGEANSRHVMDVDTCHVPEWEFAPDGKIRGGQYHYSALHWGYGPQVSTFYIDSEYLPYCYYMTGYERARDVMLERAEALARDNWQDRVARFKQNRLERSRHLYVVVKDLSVLYEATWDERLLPYLEAYLNLTLDAQLRNGKFPNIASNHYLDQPLNIAWRVFPRKRDRILRAMKRWRAYLGDALEAPTGSGVRGPMSLWTMWTLAQATGDSSLLALCTESARAQAWCVSDAEGEWRGYATFPAHLAGPILRDWVIAIAAMADLPPNERTSGMAPLLHFNAQLPVESVRERERIGRHVVLALKENGRPLKVDLHFALHNLGTRRAHRCRIFDPTDRLVDQQTHYTEESLTDPAARQGFALSVPAQGQSGVYALEIWSQGGAPPIAARASSGKVVHFMPPGRRAMTSPRSGGRAFFQPEGDAEVVIGDPSGRPWGRVVVFDPAGRPVGWSRITGTREQEVGPSTRRLPIGEPCRFRPDAGADGLYSLACGSIDWHALRELQGIKPYIAARAEEWFDPTRHPCPDLERFLQPAESVFPEQ